FPITLFLYGSSEAFYSRTNKDKEHLIFLFPLMRIISLLTLRLELRRFQDHQISKTYHCADRKSTRLNSSHVSISYAVFCLKKKKNNTDKKRNVIRINSRIQHHRA